VICAINGPAAGYGCRYGLSEDFESHTHHVLMQLVVLFKSNDVAEGIKAFIEKREAKFTGR
jgi:enoyl-CoA hydratase/carnithine racemase